MKIAIVGSRRRLDKQRILDLVDSLDLDSIIVSGGCIGVDTWAEQRAKERGLQTLIFRPNFKSCKLYCQYVDAYYARNKQIAEAADIVYAFVSPDRTGGTENTIKYAYALEKRVVIL